MFLVTGRIYTMETSDLNVYINKIHFRGPRYYKAKITLINKHNGIVYETKNYKLYPDKVKLWEVV